MNGLSLRAVSKRWSSTTAIGPVTFDVQRGEMVALVGRSGAGKSTVLALCAGWSQPDTGSIFVDGEPPSQYQPWQQVSIVPQVFALLGELSVRENIVDAVTGGSSESDDSPLDELIELLDLGEIAGRTIDQISTGQRQRVAIARALATRPTVILVDEPTGFQDAHHATLIVKALAARATDGTAVLVATHDDAVMNAADRIVTLAVRVADARTGVCGTGDTPTTLM